MRDPSQQRRAERDEILAMTEGLIAEFSGLVSAGSVMRCIARCRKQLHRSGIRHGLVPATEAAARVKLTAVVPTAAAA
jgi:hypothetical protein